MNFYLRYETITNKHMINAMLISMHIIYERKENIMFTNIYIKCRKYVLEVHTGMLKKRLGVKTCLLE